MILLSVVYAIVYTVLATVFSFMIAYIFAQLVPSPEIINIMIYEEIILNQQSKNKR
jgi:ABC-type glycerol-3-phosphate transport system permease component